MEPKILKIPNLNNKMECSSFVHITSPPRTGFIYDKLPIRLKIDPGTGIPFEVEWLDLLTYPVSEIPLFFAELSHAMDSNEIAGLLMKQLQFRKDDKVCVYLYRKV